MDNKNYKEKLIERVRNFSLEIMRFVDALDKRDLSVQVIARQLLRSATSIGANIIEAQGSSSKKDFINFMHYSFKSARETEYWLELLYYSNKGDNKRARELLKEVLELSKILNASLLSLKNKNNS